MANGYEEGLTIDRIDNDGNYCPGNCRWATNTEQQNNKSTNRLVPYNGEMMTISDAARAANIPMPTLWWRLKNEWSEDKLFIPVKRRT
jgi:hypothetical protein